MKITKRQLRRIIREEKAKLLREATPGPSYGQSRPSKDFNEQEDDSPANMSMHDAADHYERKNSPPSMDGKTADAVQLLQTAYYNLDDLAGGSTDDGVVDDVLMNMELIKNALHILGVVL